MRYYGQFGNKQGECVTVEIVTDGDTAQTVRLDGEGVTFSGSEAFVVERQPSDGQSPVVSATAVLRLQSDRLLEGLYSIDPAAAPIKVWLGDECVFDGYVEPLAYSQAFVSVADDVEVACIDKLAALELTTYRDAGDYLTDYAAIKATARVRSFEWLLRESLGQDANIYYDGSRRAPAELSDSPTLLLDGVGVSELLFLGEDEEDTWTRADVVKNVLLYLGLCIEQRGEDFYIYSRASMESAAAVTWHKLGGGTHSEAVAARVIGAETVEDTDGAIELGEAYSRVEVRCNVQDMGTLVESPMDEDSITSPFARPQKYLTEYSAPGEGERAYNTFCAMVKGTEFGVGTAAEIKASRTDWYVQVMDNLSWAFYTEGHEDVLALHRVGTSRQHEVPNMLHTKRGACLLSWGAVAEKYEQIAKDNTPISKVEMANHLCIAVNGNGEDTNLATARPSEADLLADMPLVEYKAPVSGGIFSPPDDDTTNYIIFSGSFFLQPVMAQTRTNFANVLAGVDSSKRPIWHDTVERGGSNRVGNNDGRYYTRKWYKAETCQSPAEYDPEISVVQGLAPPMEDCPKMEDFKYTRGAVGDKSGMDYTSKVAVIACMLRIGDKCLVETGVDGKPSDYKWQRYKEREDCADDDEYFAQSFTLGINPAINDYIIGTKFEMQNNVTYDMGLEKEGTAIPIKRSDHVAGEVYFCLLGPVNSVHDQITYRHRTFFRHSKWTSTSRFILPKVEAIYIKEFKVDIVSDNGKTNNFREEDLVYCSDTSETFHNPLDGLELSICTALTAERAAALGCSPGVTLSSPLYMATDTPLGEVCDVVRDRQAYPEELLVDDLYRRYHKPVEQFSATLRREGGLCRYTHPARPGVVYVPTAAAIDYQADTANIKMTRTPQDDTD